MYFDVDMNILRWLAVLVEHPARNMSGNWFQESDKCGTCRVADVMGFSGPAPELINARAAMLAIPIAAIWESTSSRTTIDLMTTSPIQFGLLVAVLTAASLVPIFKGAKPETLGMDIPPVCGRNWATLLFVSVVLLRCIVFSRCNYCCVVK